jgi:hypothetical protein
MAQIEVTEEVDVFSPTGSERNIFQNSLIKSPQSQSFSQGYRSNLPISLTYFIPSTKDYES